MGPLFSGGIGCTNGQCRAPLERVLALPDEPSQGAWGNTRTEQKADTLQLLLGLLVDMVCDQSVDRDDRGKLRKLFTLYTAPPEELEAHARQMAPEQARQVVSEGIWCKACDAPLFPIAGHIGCTTGSCARQRPATNRHGRLDTSFKRIGVLQLAQGVVQRARGATPPWPMETEKAAVAYLRARLDAWQGSTLRSSEGYDEAVHRLVEAALLEWERRE